MAPPPALQRRVRIAVDDRHGRALRGERRPENGAVVDFPAPPFDETNEMTAMTPPMSATSMNVGTGLMSG